MSSKLKLDLAKPKLPSLSDLPGFSHLEHDLASAKLDLNLILIGASSH